MKKVAIIGCGNLGRSIAEGLLQSNGEYQITATRRNTKAIEDLAQQGVEVTSDNRAAVDGADIVVLAVKPYNIESVLENVGDLVGDGSLLVSVATGVSIETMQKHVSSDVIVYRAMPNTAASVKESITTICHDESGESRVGEIMQLFEGIGQPVVIREDLMDAATVLGACGIAYAMRFIRAMTQGGIQIGFSAQMASLIASQTVKGAAELLLSGGNHPEFEIDKVTTPQGCTIVGLNEMEHAGFSSSLIKGIVSSFEEIS